MDTNIMVHANLSEDPKTGFLWLHIFQRSAKTTESQRIYAGNSRLGSRQTGCQPPPRWKAPLQFIISPKHLTISNSKQKIQT